MKPSHNETKFFDGSKVSRARQTQEMIDEDEREGSVHKAFMSWQLQLPTVIFFGLAALLSFNNDWLVAGSLTTVICFLFALMFIIFHGIGLSIVCVRGLVKWFINLV